MTKRADHTKKFYDHTNESTRIDVWDELTDRSAAAVRKFFREAGAPHLFDEVVEPTLREGNSHLIVSVRDRPWPPWGLGAQHVTALCQISTVGDESYGLSPVYVTPHDHSNVALKAALYKEALEQLARSERAEVNYLVVDGSRFADLVLRKLGFRKSEDVFLTEQARYFTYRARAGELLAQLGLAKVATADVLSGSIDDATFSKNADLHSMLTIAAAAEYLNAQAIAEIVRLIHGGHASKPGGVPSGTSRYREMEDSIDPYVFVVENVLNPAEHAALFQYAIDREQKFEQSTMTNREGVTSIDERTRRSRTLDDLGDAARLIEDRVRGHLSKALERLKYPAFPVGRIEMQITASNDGDFFRMHPDSDGKDTREFSFVYFFNEEPQRFSGGELRVFETRVENGRAIPIERSQIMAPRDNRMVLFNSRSEHEVLPVRVPSRKFADSRFTVNGWVHRAK